MKYWGVANLRIQKKPVSIGGLSLSTFLGPLLAFHCTGPVYIYVLTYRLAVFLRCLTPR